jgi:uncharacterized protein (DUF2237 family)
MQKNIFGNPISLCSNNPLTGFLRNGYCHIDTVDHGMHIVCAKITKDFLEFTKSRGNDLPLKPGDFWCLCAFRWLEAYYAGVAPPVLLEATNIESLKIIPLSYLYKHRL